MIGLRYLKPATQDFTLRALFAPQDHDWVSFKPFGSRRITVDRVIVVFVALHETLHSIFKINDGEIPALLSPSTASAQRSPSMASK